MKFVSKFLIGLALVAVSAVSVADEFCFHTLNRTKGPGSKTWDDVTFQVNTVNPVTDSNGYIEYTLTGHAINALGDTGAVYGTAFTKLNSNTVRFDINSNLKLVSQPKISGVPITRPLLISLDTLPLAMLETPVPGVAYGNGLIELVDVGYVPVDVAATACSTFGTYFFFP